VWPQALVRARCTRVLRVVVVPSRRDGAARAVRAMVATGSGFEADEAAVLSWLLARPDVVKAVDLASSGKENEALQTLVGIVKGLLDEGVGAAEDAGIAATAGSKRGAPDAGDAAEGSSGQGATGAALTSPAKRSRSGALSSPNTGLARCVCVIMSGLHGCGKSALCNILRDVLGGTWLNADELASPQKGGKTSRQAFASEFRAALARGLQSADQNRHERIIFVDRANTLRNHRSDLIQTLKKVRWRLRGGTVLFVDFTHSADSFGYGVDGQLAKRYSEHHIAVCQRRIEERGAAHHTLQPSPKLRAMLQASAKAAEAPTPEELTAFDSRVTVEVTQMPPAMALAVIEELRRLRWLSALRGADELMPRVEVAWQAYQRAESQWRAGVAAAAPDPHREWLSQCRRALQDSKAKEKEKVQQAQAQSATDPSAPSPAAAVPLYWKIDLPEVSKVLMQRGILPAEFTPIERPHTTLLYVGGEGDDATVAKRNSLPVEQFQAMRDALEALQGEEFEVKMTEIVIEEHVACAVVSLPPILPCSNKVPHVTLGTKPGVAPRYANELLEEVRAGRREGLTSIPLPTPRPLKGRVALEYSGS